MTTNIAEFKIANDGDSSSLALRLGTFNSFLNTVKEWIGPSGYEGYCRLKAGEITIPHIDEFSRYNQYKNIVLVASTEEYSIPIYGNSFVDSVKQYFLENKTRDGIQCLFWNNEAAGGSLQYTAMIPGLLYTSSSNIFAYLHSYVANVNGDVVLELPYDDYLSYTLSGAPSMDQVDNIITIHGIIEETQLMLSNGTSNVYFKLYAYNSSSGSTVYKIKNVNEYFDYIIAAQLTDGKIASILNMLTEIEFRDANYYPKYFTSLRLYTSSEAVKNITPNIYKVPVALVPANGGKVLLKNVTGISANII